jgi:uncharacterized protein YbjT (DUF2867 family)
MKVTLLGATGLVGHHCLDYLLEAKAVSTVIAPTRRPLQKTHPKLHAVVVEFDQLQRYPELFKVQATICCLGSTIKQAGSKEQFEKVDLHYCVTAARLGHAAGVSTFLVVSAQGASADSRLFYYQVKGRMEQQLRALSFKNLSIYHPGVLVGKRTNLRFGETIWGTLAPLTNRLLIGPLRPYRSIEAKVVAHAMVNELLSLAKTRLRYPSVAVHPYDDIVKLAGER